MWLGDLLAGTGIVNYGVDYIACKQSLSRIESYIYESSDSNEQLVVQDWYSNCDLSGYSLSVQPDTIASTRFLCLRFFVYSNFSVSKASRSRLDPLTPYLVLVLDQPVSVYFPLYFCTV